ncbi:MAG: bifunctional transaldolase/phosoglucose isomerase, partial [Vulcanimicrobiaceae bacterium]
MANQLSELQGAGQSVWLDNIRRSMFASGELARLIGLGVRGMTSNPTIFEKAIGSGSDYDEQLRALTDSGRDPAALFEALAVDDIRHACDAFKPIYDASGGADGFVSLEVSPLLAHDTSGTIAAAKHLWSTVARPNVMIKIPGTPGGMAAISASIADGININVTLLFAREAYAATAEAYITGLERRAAAGLPIERIASVASVFVSRIDTAVDKLLEERIRAGATQLAALRGTVGLANSRLIYEAFERIFASERFTKLAARGARMQRPLWASTGTKNPAYSDLLYVENLIGPQTVNTVPPATLDALLDHGRIRPGSIREDLEGARATLAALAAANLSLFDVMGRLQVEGVKSFADSYELLLAAIATKTKQLAGGRESLELGLGNYAPLFGGALERLANPDFLAKLWAHDPAPWTSDPAHKKIIEGALGWLDFPGVVLEHAGNLREFAGAAAKLFSHVVVLGMGGSSLAPDVLRATFGQRAGFPELHVLDSSDPVQIAALEAQIDLARTLFIVASKSGTTLEPEAFFRYFFERVQKIVGAEHAGEQFVAITDPQTQLAAEAKEASFRAVYLNDPEIGGRYSALSYFGMIPAALAGYEFATILERGLGALAANGRSVAPAAAPGVRLGAALG